jgi:uncharacterized cupredoxin-like copper-binding protein
MDTRRTMVGLAGLAMLSLVVAGCTSSGGASPSAGANAATVDVTLQEWSVGVVPGSAAAGEVTFSVTNDGPNDVHEFVVIKTDLSFIALPTDETGAVDETQPGMEVMGEIEDVAVGTTQELALTLEPGAYALICNIYSAEEQEAHYQEGMRAQFTVTE